MLIGSPRVSQSPGSGVPFCFKWGRTEALNEKAHRCCQEITKKTVKRRTKRASRSSSGTWSARSYLAFDRCPVTATGEEPDEAAFDNACLSIGDPNRAEACHHRLEPKQRPAPQASNAEKISRNIDIQLSLCDQNPARERNLCPPHRGGRCLVCLTPFHGADMRPDSIGIGSPSR